MNDSAFDTGMIMTPLGDKICEVLMEITRCPICLDTLLIPKTLRCGHTFCMSCLNVIKNKVSESADILKCPLCRCDQIIIAGIEKLNEDRTIATLLRTFQSFESAIVSHREVEQMMEEIIFCVKCKNVLEDPKRLLCGHTICTKCLDDIIETKTKTEENLFHCPKCDCDHIIFPGLNYFKRDVPMTSLLELIAKTDLCEDFKQEMGAEKNTTTSYSPLAKAV